MKEYDMVYALAILSACRNANVVMSGDTTAPATAEDADRAAERQSNRVRSEVRNIVIEHLNHDQLVELLTDTLVAEAGSALDKVCQISLMTHGEVQWDKIVAHTEEFCTRVLGRQVKVVED